MTLYFSKPFCKPRESRRTFVRPLALYWVIVTLIGSFLVLGASKRVQARPGGSGPVPVIVAPAVMQSFEDEIHALGTTRAKETVVITADTTEKITGLHFEEGQVVSAGDLLVTLDQRREMAQLRAAKAQLAESRAAYARAENLKKRSALSAATVQERLSEQTRNEVEVDVIEARLAELRIQAPFSGVIGLRHVSVGALVKPGDPITRLDDLSQIKVDFQVPSRYLSVLKPGLTIRGTVAAFKKQVFRGQVSSIDTQVDPVTRSVMLRALLPNPDRKLRPGLLMTVALAHSPRKALMVPEEAIIKRVEKNLVFLVSPEEGPRVQHQIVTIGSRRAGQVEILSGLSAGDQIVVHGVNKLRPGAEVVIRGTEENNETLQEILNANPAS